MPTVSDSIPLLGGTAMADTQATVSLIGDYADLLYCAEDSNRPTSFLAQLM